jgi:hypothetical protein
METAMSSPSDRVPGTLPLNTSAPTLKSSRRGFLVQAAGIAAGGAALGATLPLPTPPATIAQGSDPDPIFAAIEAHQRAIAAHAEAVDIESRLDESLSDEQQSDDPRWLAATKALNEASSVMDDMGIELLNTELTTLGGIEALLRHFADRDEGIFPSGVCNDDGSEETFDTELIRYAADALREIARPNCPMARQRDEVQS